MDPRKVWPSESADFTPWLAEHLGALGSASAMELALDEPEAPVGAFSLDLLATEVGTARRVVTRVRLDVGGRLWLSILVTAAGPPPMSTTPAFSPPGRTGRSVT